jgi:S-adenosylmethionine-diacylglycerol 3-amino-3-carboxypropyl transferase
MTLTHTEEFSEKLVVKSAPLKFSVVREDPRLEESLLDNLGSSPKKVFCVAGAGCTLLQISLRSDTCQVVGTDIDPYQAAWARLRLAAVRLLNRKDFCRLMGISQIDPSIRETLMTKAVQVLPPEDRAFFKSEKAFFINGAFDDGIFERLFSCWRSFVEKFFVSEKRLQNFFDGDSLAIQDIIQSELWPVSFDLFFHQRLLKALFGSNALQHAPPGSYPRYFQARFEWALAQPEAPRNPYLSHVLRGRYGALDQPYALPDFLQSSNYDRLAESVGKVTCLTGSIVESLASNPGPYHLIQLSNILDWSSEEDSEAIAKPILENLAPGGYLLIRQLNNVRPLPSLWMRELDFDPTVERELLSTDRSFFYSAIRVGKKTTR